MYTDPQSIGFSFLGIFERFSYAIAWGMLVKEFEGMQGFLITCHCRIQCADGQDIEHLLL
jgi:hypothetical protein